MLTEGWTCRQMANNSVINKCTFIKTLNTLYTVRKSKISFQGEVALKLRNASQTRVIIHKLSIPELPFLVVIHSFGNIHINIKFLLNILMVRNYRENRKCIQRQIIQEASMPELWFLLIIHCPIILQSLIKLH